MNISASVYGSTVPCTQEVSILYLLEDRLKRNPDGSKKDKPSYKLIFWGMIVFTRFIGIFYSDSTTIPFGET